MKLLKLTSISDTYPITVDELRDYLKINDDRDEELLKNIIKSAVKLFENYTGNRLITYRAAYEQSGNFNQIFLPENCEIISLIATDHLGNHHNIAQEQIQPQSRRHKIQFYQPMKYCILECILNPTMDEDECRYILLAIAGHIFYNRDGKSFNFETLNQYKLIRL